MRASFPCTVFFGTVMMLLLVNIGYGEEESSSTSSCVSSLIPCTPYVTNASATKPPATCCSPLLTALEKQTECLCKLLNSNAVASLGVRNVSQALDLPARCGSNITTSICTTKENGGTQSPTNSTTPSQENGNSSGNATATSKGDTSASASSSHLPAVEVLALLSVALLLSSTFRIWHF